MYRAIVLIVEGTLKYTILCKALVGLWRQGEMEAGTRFSLSPVLSFFKDFPPIRIRGKGMTYRFFLVSGTCPESISAVVPNRRCQVLGIKISEEAFTTSCSGWDLWKLQSKNISGPKAGNHCTRDLDSADPTPTPTYPWCSSWSLLPLPTSPVLERQGPLGADLCISPRRTHLPCALCDTHSSSHSEHPWHDLVSRGQHSGVWLVLGWKLALEYQLFYQRVAE